MKSYSGTCIGNRQIAPVTLLNFLGSNVWRRSFVYENLGPRQAALLSSDELSAVLRRRPLSVRLDSTWP